jgi:hypothetical protein
MAESNENVTIEDVKLELRLLTETLRGITPAMNMVHGGFKELKESFDDLKRLLTSLEGVEWPKEDLSS